MNFIQALKIKIVETYDKYLTEYCSYKGEVNDGKAQVNPTKELNSIRERVEAKELIVTETDKTNKITVMKSEKYVASMKEHFENDKVISKKELNNMEMTLNEQLWR